MRKDVMKRISLLLTALIFAFTSTVSLADAMKIGVVDLQKIMRQSSQMKDIQSKLEKKFKPRRDQLVASEQKVKKDMEKFKRDQSVMSEKQRKELEKKIVKAQQEFEQQGQKYQQELSAEHNKAMEKFYGHVRDAIAKTAKDNQYDVVLQKDAAPYSNDKLDITDKVMKVIG